MPLTRNNTLVQPEIRAATDRIINVVIDVIGLKIQITVNHEDMNSNLVGSSVYTISGQNFVSLVNQVPDGNSSMYENIKRLLYEQLITQSDLNGVIT